MPPVLARIVVIAAAASLVAVGVAWAGVGRWGPSHGPEGGLVSALVIDPSNSAVLYAGTSHGVFKTTNAGVAWSDVSAGLTDPSVTAIAIDPRRPGVVYAGTENGRFFKSIDGGTTWRGVGESTLRLGWVNTLVVNPLDTETLFAGGDKGVFKSTNAGVTWRPASAGLTRRIVGALAIDPLVPSTLFAGASSPSNTSPYSSVFKSTDGGASWREILGGLRGGICGVALDPANPAAVYTGGQMYDREVGILFKSVDAGETWTAIPGDGCSSLAVDFTQTPNVIYTTTLSSLGPMKSTDEGLTWARMGKSLPPQGWGGGIVALDRRNPGTLYLTSGDFGVFKSTSGGDPWRARNHGLVGRRIRSLVVDPLDGRTVYAGTAGGIYRSTDGGASWEAPRLPALLVNALAFDPSHPSRMYAASWKGVHRSADSGRSWRIVKDPLFRYGVTALTIDPKEPSTLYARAGSVWLRKTWRFATSVDGGESWHVLKPGLPGRWVDLIAVDPHDTSTLYAGTWPTFRNERLVGGGVFRSVDGGRSWRAAGLAGMVVSGLAIDPGASRTVYAGTDRGVHRSIDGGRTWTRTGPRRVFVGGCDVILDPRVSSTVYAACGERVYRSTNGARTWRAFDRGLGGREALTLAIDSTGRTLYAGTDAGVYDYRFAR